MGDDEQITPDGDYHEDNSHKLRSARFELYGYIRRRAFKQKIMDKTQSLGIRGYCMVHNRDYVSGLIQGRPQQFDEMFKWMSNFENLEYEVDTIRIKRKRAIRYTKHRNFRVDIIPHTEYQDIGDIISDDINDDIINDDEQII
ncbi:acylphosphatase-1-like isoform X1 [Rhynchophorus ferrugineus]|uniref:acylphosphatase-1-like isoform X1 n=1 Tax=Rhynchophorus ferrugineus TaxID=354439 RepID=UPI003FCC862C